MTLDADEMPSPACRLQFCPKLRQLSSAQLPRAVPSPRPAVKKEGRSKKSRNRHPPANSTTKALSSEDGERRPAIINLDGPQAGARPLANRLARPPVDGCPLSVTHMG